MDIYKTKISQSMLIPSDSCRSWLEIVFFFLFLHNMRAAALDRISQSILGTHIAPWILLIDREGVPS